MRILPCYTYQRMRQLFTSLFAGLFILVTAAAVIAYGRGHVFDFQKKAVTATGILSVASFPEKASIWIDDALSAVTNASVSLLPGEYRVRIRREGYQDWEQTVMIRAEIVSTIDALLVPVSPSLRTLTTSGVIRPALSPSKTKVVYLTVDDQTPRSNVAVESYSTTSSAALESRTGIWMLELRTGALGWKQEPKKLYTPRSTVGWTFPRLSWAADESTIIADSTSSAILFSSTQTDIPATQITSSTLATLRTQWDLEAKKKQELAVAALTQPVSTLLATAAGTINFSPDETKILYEATASAVIPAPKHLLIGSNSTPETRQIEPGGVYIYDQKEERNYFITHKEQIHSLDTAIWYTDSKHIVTIEKDTIYIVDYDGTNKRTVYAGPFDPDVVYAWPAGGKLIILTNFNKPETLPNLYLLDLT